MENNTSLVVENPNLCPRCQKNKASEPHTCPYAEEIGNDKETECTCCSECTRECAMDI